MRLNYNNWPILKYLQSPETIKDIPIDPPLRAYLENQPKSAIKLTNIYNCIDECVFNAFRKPKWYYITLPFLDALAKSSPKLVDPVHQALSENKFIPEIGIYMSHKGLSFFFASINPSLAEWSIMCLSCDREKVFNFFVYHRELGTHGYFPRWVEDKKEEGSFYLGHWVNDMKSVRDCMVFASATIYFIQNCELETKVVKPGEKVKVHGDKHMNETSSPITMLDCNWFTTLVRDTPFTVSGHLRWQPCGPGFSKKKLIWIEGFKKEGYTKKARKSITDASNH